MRTPIQKYVILKDSSEVWIARVPYGSYNSFDTWNEAMGWINNRIRLKAAREEVKRNEKKSRDTAMAECPGHCWAAVWINGKRVHKCINCNGER